MSEETEKTNKDDIRNKIVSSIDDMLSNSYRWRPSLICYVSYCIICISLVITLLTNGVGYVVRSLITQLLSYSIFELDTETQISNNTVACVNTLTDISYGILIFPIILIPLCYLVAMIYVYVKGRYSIDSSV